MKIIKLKNDHYEASDHSVLTETIINLLTAFKLNQFAKDDDLGETWDNFKRSYRELTYTVQCFIDCIDNDNDPNLAQFKGNSQDDRQFIEEIYELAFGDDAINRGYSHEEVIKEIREFSDKALEMIK